MPPEPHGPEDDGISHPPLQPADPQEGDDPRNEEEGSGERLVGEVAGVLCNQ